MFIFDFHWQIQHFLNQFWWQINFLLLVILVVLGYLAIKKPVYAAGLTIILLPTYLFRSNILGVPFTYLELCILVTFIGWVLNLIFYNLQPKTYNLKNYRLPITLILLASTISLFLSPSLRAAAGLWKAYFIEPILFFIILTNVIKTKNDKKIILWSLGVSTLAISLLGIFQKLTGFGIYEPSWTAPANRRVTSFFSSPNAVGLFLGPIVVIYGGWLLAEIKNLKAAILKSLIVIPALLAILFTFSQGTWLGLAAALIFIFFFSWNKKITTSVVIALIVLSLIVPMTRQIILPLITFQDAAGQNRLELAKISGQYLLASPKNFILGAGIGSFAQIQNQARDPLKMEVLLYPHNIFLNFWLETGLLGLIGFIWLIIKFFRKGFARVVIPAKLAPDTDRGAGVHGLKWIPDEVGDGNHWLALGLLAAMIAIVIHGLVDVPYFKNDLAVLFWIIIALI
ncbi:MAG TPA: O-antigen ligase family protein [Patescibacteria group bacterium]|nr:O-antigen ligase family protein [Patescibacteria group bacterium]